MTRGKTLAVILLLATLGIQGCAGLALVGAGVGAGTAVDHTLSGIAYKTFKAPLGDLHFASLSTLRDMEFKVTDDTETSFGRRIAADAPERHILIELERLTPNTTRMRVTADQPDSILRDRATATEIILQTVEAVDRRLQAIANK